MKNLFKFALAAIVLLGAASCSNDDNNSNAEGEGTITVALAGDQLPASRFVSTTTFDEDAVGTYFVIVYNYGSPAALPEKVVPGEADKVTTITGVTTSSTKRIVVVANTVAAGGAAAALAELQTLSYTALMADDYLSGAAVISQAALAANNLAMYGEKSPVTINPTGPNTVQVNLKRVMAKITLGTITVDPGVANFTITGVGVQKASNLSRLDPTNFATTATQTWLGGQSGSVSTADATLFNTITAQAGEYGNYFYVLKNNGSVNPTLLSIQAEYDADGAGGDPSSTLYYSVIVNPPTGTAGTTGGNDGTYVQANHQYKVNFTITNPSKGSTDPDLPVADADLQVEIVIEPWDLLITQTTDI